MCRGVIRTGSLLQLQGLGFRNRLMLHYTIKKCRLISDAEKRFEVFCVPTNASPTWVKSGCKPNRCPAAVPKARYVIVSYRLKRIGMVSCDEYFAAQQLSFRDFLGTHAWKYHKIAQLFSYGDMMQMAGNSFHSGSCGHFVISTLLLPKLKRFGEVARL